MLATTTVQYCWMLRLLVQHLGHVRLPGVKVSLLGTAMDAELPDIAMLQANVALQFLLCKVTNYSKRLYLR